MFRKNNFPYVRKKISRLLGEKNILENEVSLMAYSYDSALSRAKPDAVINFTDISQIAPVVKILYEAGVPYIPRMAGTNLSGGTIPIKGGVVLNLARLNRIIRIDTDKHFALVEPGVVNLDLQQELEKFGFFYPPDPASQKVSTIGGNIGENAGGPRCLKYGVTTNNVLKIETVTPRGEIETLDLTTGPQLLSLICGSEGTLGIVRRAWLKIVPLRQKTVTIFASFQNLESAITTVTRIVAEGIIPSCLEAMDEISINAAGRGKNVFSPPCGAALLIEINSEFSLEKESRKINEICRANGCLSLKSAESFEERQKMWQLRKDAYPAMARLAPNVLVEDGVVPRPKLVQALKAVKNILEEEKVEAGILFHAGDGNLHPSIIFDERDIYQVKRVKRAAYRMLKTFISCGGFISGEHGVGIEKRMAMAWQYPTKTLNLFKRVKEALDPKNLANPDKIIPVALKSRNEMCLRKTVLSGPASYLQREVESRFRTKTPSAVFGLKTSKPEIAGEELSLKELKGIVEFDRDNFTIKAECGISVESLKEYLRKEGIEFPLPEYKGSLGGLISSRHFLVRKEISPSFYSVNMIKDFLLGVDILLPNGEFHELGGKTLKNVAGYDLARLFIGSMGCYGIILSATIRVDHLIETRLNFTGEPLKIGSTSRKLKQVFDPFNLFNRNIYGQRNANYN